ncbi:hypothetical protein ACM0L0_01855 [Mycoplasma sp. 005V]|uniref:hypothetical protein n=1 Tax=Mycoplasma sp. 005V TaxID=3398776 RepID=UPI003A85126D
MNKKAKLLLKASPVLSLPIMSTVLLASNPTGSVSVSNTEIWKDNNSAYVYFRTQSASTEYPRYYGKYQANQWMKDVNDNKTLFQMSLPGTHDSGAWEGYGAAWTFGWRYGRTQAMSYTQQLNAGIRAFDLRSDSQINIRHGATYLYSTLTDALNSMADFLEKNPSEFIFLRVKDESFDVNNAWYANQAAENYLKLLSQPKIYNRLFNPQGLEFWQLSQNDFKLKNLRGKIVIANFWHNKVQSKMIEIQNNYKAKVWSGGFNYWEAISRSTMQDNYNASYEQKYNDAVKFMPLANDNAYDSRQLYLNFFSVAGGYPYNSSADLNPKFNKVLSDNEQYTKLGLVYMDYPGPAIIENVFKRNYYLTDEQLKHNYISTWNTKFSASNPLVNDNHLTIQGENLAGYNVEVKQGNQIIASFTVPEGVKNQYTAELNSNIYFPLNASYTINAYRMTPANAFYPARAYNQFSYNVNVINTVHNQNIEAFKADLNQWKNKIKQAHGLPNLDSYLNNTYFEVLKTILRPTQTNETKLTELKSKFAQDKSNMDNLIKELENAFNTNSSLLDKNSSNLALILEPSTIQTLKRNLETTFKTQLNTNISNNEINFNKVKQYIENYLNMNNYLVLDAQIYATSASQLSQIIIHYPYKNLGIEVWEKKLADYKAKIAQLNTQFNQNYNIATGLEVYSDLKNQLSAFSAQLNQLSDFISNLNQLIAQYKLSKAEVLLFSNQIKPAVESLTNIDAITTSFKNYSDTLNEAKALLAKNETFKTEYKFNEFTTALRESYLAAINQLKTEINEQGLNPTPLETLKSQIGQIELIKQNIIALFQSEKHVYDLPNLFDWQKQGYIKMIAALNGSDLATKLQALLKQIEQINELNPLQTTQEDFLAPLNAEERKLLNFGTTADLVPEKFITKFNSIINLRQATINLKQATNSLNDLSLALANGNILSAENSQKLNEALQKANETINNSASLESFTQGVEQINQVNEAIAANYKETVKNFIAQVTASNKLFTYQKNTLNSKINNSELSISNVNTYLEATKEFSQLEKDNLPEQKLATLDSLSAGQKQQELVILNEQATLDSFNLQMQQATELNSFINKIKASYQALNYQQEDYYLHASEQQKETVNSLANEFNSLLQTSLQSDQIQAKYDELTTALNHLKQEYLAAQTDINELINQLKSTIKQLEEFNIQEFASYKTNYLQQAGKYLELLQDSSKPFNDKANVIELIDKINHLLQVGPSWKRDYDQINNLIAQGQKQFQAAQYASVLAEFNKVVSQVKDSSIYQAQNLESIKSNSLQPLLNQISQAYQVGIKKRDQIDLDNKKQELSNELEKTLQSATSSAKEQILAHLASEINKIKQDIEQLKNPQNANTIKQAINTLANNISLDNSYAQSYQALQNQLQAAKNNAADQYNLPAYDNMLDSYQSGIDKFLNQLSFDFNLDQLTQISNQFTAYQANAAKERQVALEQYNLAKSNYEQALKVLNNFAAKLTNPLFNNLVANINSFINQHQLSDTLNTFEIKELTQQIQNELIVFQNQEKEIVKQVLDTLKDNLSNVKGQINQIELSQFEMVKEHLTQQASTISASLNSLSFTLEQKEQLQNQIQQLQATIQQVINIQPEYKTLLSTMQQYQAKVAEFNAPENLKLIAAAYLSKLQGINSLPIFSPKELSQITSSNISDAINKIKQAYSLALEQKKALKNKQTNLSKELKALEPMQNSITTIIEHNKADFSKIQNDINALDNLQAATNIQNEIQALKEKIASQLVYDKAYKTAKTDLEDLLTKANDFSLPIESEVKNNYQTQINKFDNDLEYNFDNSELNIILTKAQDAYQTAKVQANSLVEKYQTNQTQINELANTFKQLLKDNEAKLAQRNEEITSFLDQEIAKASSDDLTFNDLQNIYSKIETYYNEVKKSLNIDNPEPVEPEPNPNPVSPEPEPHPEPVEPEPNPNPVNPEPEPTPVVPDPEPNPEPSPVTPEPEPSPAEPKPTPVEPEPVNPEPEPTPVVPTPVEPVPVPNPEPDTPLHSSPEVTNQPSSSHSQLAWLALLIIPLIGIPLFIILRKRRKNK